MPARDRLRDTLGEPEVANLGVERLRQSATLACFRFALQFEERIVTITRIARELIEALRLISMHPRLVTETRKVASRQVRIHDASSFTGNAT